MNIFTKGKILVTGLFLGLCISASGQKCITDQINYNILNKRAELMQSHQELYNNVPASSGNKRSTKYIIPVVFHVIHTNGEENISKAQIEDQIRILNEDFNFNNSNKNNIRNIFAGVAANMEIEFRLARLDPQGNCTDGINRVYSSRHVNAGDEVKSLPMARWPHDKYLNIWIVSSINSGGAGGGTILGYAYFPSTSQDVTFSAFDGVICRSDYVGSIGTSSSSRAGRVLTHEVGHYLGLLHPFQDSCNGGDHCEDTPPVYGTYTNANCNPNNNSCHNDHPDLPDQFENFMDYSEGRCQAMFTLGQKNIVYNTFANYAHRAHLVSQENLIATGVVTDNIAPLAGFTSSARTICAGRSVTFNETSCKSQVTGRSWAFEGGDISASASINPTVKYEQPGFYKVSLTVTNAQGSNTIEKTEYIHVLPGEAIEKASLRQTFENPDFQPAEGWQVVTEEGVQTFKHTTMTGYKSQSCLMADIKTPMDIARPGFKYRLISPKVDLRPLNGLGPKLSFMCAYAKPNATSKEVLRVYTSTDCGNTWVQRYFRQEANLVSTNQPNPAFVPVQPGEWRQHSVPLSGFQSELNIMFMIEVESGAGGNVYLDDINVGQFNTSVDEVTIGDGLELYPVPARNEVNLVFESLTEGDAMIEIKNTLGQLITSFNRPVSQGGQHINLQLDGQLSTGVYFVTVKAGSQTFINKLVIENH